MRAACLGKPRSLQPKACARLAISMRAEIPAQTSIQPSLQRTSKHLWSTQTIDQLIDSYAEISLNTSLLVLGFVIRMKSSSANRPPRKAGRPLGVDVAIVTRKNILDAATLCFAELGYAAASNREIAQRAGVTSGSLYHYFDSKAALYREAVREAHTRLVASYLEAAEEHPQLASVDQLCLGLERAFAVAEERPGMMSLAAAATLEIQRNQELDWPEHDDAEAFPQFLRRLLKRARKRGELGAGVNIENLLSVFLTVFASLAFLQRSQLDQASFAASLKAFQQLLRGEAFTGAKSH